MNIRNFNDLKQYVSENKDVKRCMVRCDLNLPSDIEDLTRIHSIKDTVHELLSLGLDVILISHYKRPKLEDVIDPKYSLKNIVEKVSNVLQIDVSFVKYSVFDIQPSDITSKVTLFENLRFYEGETKNDEELARRLAKFADIYINDAFSVSHRAHASVSKITEFLPSFAGLSLEREINGITKVTNNIEKPFTAIIGGSKVSSKIGVLNHISKTANYLIITGAMANTFLASQGVDLQNSLVEPDQFNLCREILQNSKAEIILPVDFIASNSISVDGSNYSLDKIPDGFSCFDIGEKSTANVVEILGKTRTLLWNGATGAFEFANFNRSSNIISEAIAEKTKAKDMISVVGGGETVASIGGYKNDMTFVSTAGGAFLEFVTGDELPGIICLSLVSKN